MRRPRLNKRLGQHHLIRSVVLQPLLDFLDPAGRRVLEIGSGGGALTRELVRLGANVTTWEIDLPWVFALRENRPPGAIQQVAGDVLTIDWSLLPAGTLVAGNLPYNIATTILDDILTSSSGITRMAFMIQREVAERLAALPGDRAYSALSVLTQARARVEILGTVEAAAFRPPPKVESALVGLTPGGGRGLLDAGAWSRFRATVYQAFAYRRKTLVNSLAVAWGRQRAVSLTQRAGFAPGIRAGEIGIEGFVLLARLAGSTSSTGKGTQSIH